MGSTWLIFGGIALGWIAYLGALFVRKNGGSSEDAVARLSQAATVYRPDGAALVDHDFHPIEFSTPLTRRAEVAEVRRIDRTAARRRRTVLAVLFGLLVTAGVLAGTGFVPWWALAIPGGLLVGFAVVARFSVRVLRRQLDARLAAINRGHEEATVALTKAEDHDAGGRVSLGSPTGKPALWDPLPITRPTYVSKPLAPRTVRTIDLSAPEPEPLSDLPVTADEPVAAPAETSSHEDSSAGATVSRLHARSA